MHPLSPIYRYCEYNGVRVNEEIRYCYLPFLPGSDYRPTGATDIPGYEATLCHCLSRLVTRGDHVVVVGGGLGVTTVHAATATGGEGRVTVYEASEARFADLTRAIRFNEVDDRVEAIQGVVGNDVKVYGEKTGKRIFPADLPVCDVLELDCEGAEVTILEEMEILPRNIVVETHGFRGAPTSKVKGLLSDRGYRVTDLGLAEPRLRSVCEDRDIRVLAAERN